MITYSQSQEPERTDTVKGHLKVLVYKRTHKGDPDDRGIFGIDDCMGKVRMWDFVAVIGVGGKRPDRGHEDIAGKVNWVGIGAHENGNAARGRRLAFDRFYRFDEAGEDFKKLAPRLFKYMFEDKHRRALLSQNLPDKKMKDEVERVLMWAEESEHIPKSLPIKKNRSSKCGC
jgi:hypothetical protein